MKITTATIADVETALLAFQVAAERDANLEVRSGKKLAAVVEALTPKDGVTKDLNQAYTNGEKWHAVNAKTRKHGCTPENEQEKIKWYIQNTDAYARHFGNPETKAKVEGWLAETFPVAV
ncbi:hypothetical protein GMSM_25790 [Geomonas sp. Red276]